MAGDLLVSVNDVGGEFLPVVTDMPALRARVRTLAPDLVLAAGLAAAAMLACHAGTTFVARALDPTNQSYMDAYFDSDVPRVYTDMVERWGNHWRTRVHPLFVLATYPWIFAASRGLGLKAPDAVTLLDTAIAGLWVALFYALLRSMRCKRLDAAIFTVVCGSSAASIFWFVVPESYALGSMTMLTALLVASVASVRRVPACVHVLAGAASLSMLVTNWMVGLLSLVNCFRVRQAAQLAINSFFLVVVAWGVQKAIFPTSEFFLGTSDPASYFVPPHSGGPMNIARVFFLNAMVMPEVQARLAPGYERGWPILTAQFAQAGSGGLWGLLAVGTWVLLLAAGLWSIRGLADRKPLRNVLVGSVLGQLALALVYGAETFLYALNFVPLLVLVAATSTLTRLRPAALALALVLIPLNLANNTGQLARAVAMLSQPVPASAPGVTLSTNAR